MSKLNKNLMAAVAAGMLAVSGASGAVTFSDGGAGLQALLDGNPAVGSGVVDVNADQMSDTSDSYWNFGGTAGSIQVILGENTLNASNNSFGLFSGVSALEIFKGSDLTGYKGILTYDSLTSQINVIVKNGVTTVRDNTVGWAGNPFGFYLNNGTDTFYSDSDKNSGVDAMVGYLNKPNPGESILAFEDDTLNGQNVKDTDYDDFVVMVESVYVPEPTTLALLGLGLIGMGYRARRKSA